MAPASKSRTVILTVAVAAITATGAWYGASLKIGQDVKKGQQAAAKFTPTQNIQHLEAIRVKLVRQRDDLERKIHALEVKHAAKNACAGGQSPTNTP
ncbi:uncharacterized protein K489DRAFT_405922 [Dissoconium aciculare CBS 342.82]|uniref:Uncharacterized protein n=1 Tax=Dissoconium aciculare CBS 342.82 TaxID=1314786 RepID=A0A6J3MJS3_9PEZI|nr:uncharacterized protein K489DRAFT_405922 [Dissoconium aciculare CBS 342.82]KAF1827192.1 hypothetical protein K489DRAFT_405922 [Dissoconium aciculare CBS 342.82]